MWPMLAMIGLADVEMRGQRRQLDIRQHAAFLGAVAVGPVELLHGNLQRAHRARQEHQSLA